MFTGCLPAEPLSSLSGTSPNDSMQASTVLVRLCSPGSYFMMEWLRKRLLALSLGIMSLATHASQDVTESAS
jgi:hypothetical protein